MKIKITMEIPFFVLYVVTLVQQQIYGFDLAYIFLEGFGRLAYVLEGTNYI